MAFTSTSIKVLIKGYVVDENGNPLSDVKVDITIASKPVDLSGGINVPTVDGINTPSLSGINIPSIKKSIKLTSNSNGEWSTTVETTNFDPKGTTIVLTKDDYELKNINSLSKTGDEGDTEIYDVSRVTLFLSPNFKDQVKNLILQEINKQEGQDISKQSRSKLDAQAKILVSINEKKKDLKNILLPTVIELLAPFGALALQAILKKLPTNQILSLCKCPKKSIILNLIKKRNNLARAVNNIYTTVKSISSVLTTIETIIAAIRVGILAIEILPYPATGVPPVLPPLTSGLIQTIGSVKDGLKDLLKLANVGITLLNMTLSTFSIILGAILKLLSLLDALILKCAEDKNVNFNTINNELNLFVNTSTGVSNSRVIAELNNTSPIGAEFISLQSPELDAARVFLNEQRLINDQLVAEPDELTTPIQLDTFNQAFIDLINVDPVVAETIVPNNNYRGFKLEIKLDEASTSKYPKRFAQALNAQGVPVLKTESSFASDPQVLLSELKFIIDSNPNLTAE
jgi:hypothetical protein